MSKRTLRRELGLVALCAAGVALAHLIDRPVLLGIPHDKGWLDPTKKVPDWRLVLRTLGYLPVWWVLAFTMWLAISERGRRLLWRGRIWCLAVLPTVCMFAAEFTKMIVRRRRPRDAEYGYAFKPWDGEIGSSGMAFPSSHAVVAFAGAAVLSAIWPRATWLWWLLALGTGLSRISAHAHFPSDVAMSAALAFLLVRWLRPFFFRREEEGGEA